MQPGQRSIVSLLRLSHSVHLAVCTLTTVMASGLDEQTRNEPPGVRGTGLDRGVARPGVRGVAVTDGEGDGGGGIGVLVGFAGGGGGDGVLGCGEDMAAVSTLEMDTMVLRRVSSWHPQPWARETIPSYSKASRAKQMSWDRRRGMHEGREE